MKLYLVEANLIESHGADLLYVLNASPDFKRKNWQ